MMAQVSLVPALVLHDLFESYLRFEGGPDDAEERAWGERSLRQALDFEKGDLRFLSDSAKGAVFYFSKAGNRWVLVALDTSDCSV